MENKIEPSIRIITLIGLLLIVACSSGKNPVNPIKNATPVLTFEKMETLPVEPRPDFIQAIGPPEYSIVSNSIYKYKPDGKVGHGIQSVDLGIRTSVDIGYQESICVRPLVKLLVQEGDIFVGYQQKGDKAKDRMELLVDGKMMKPYSYSNGGIPYSVNSDSPEIPLTEWIEGADYCWYAPLSIGEHKVEFRFRQSSGNIQKYTWFFEIEE